MYEDSSRPKGLTASGARRPLTSTILVLQRKAQTPDECPGRRGSSAHQVAAQAPADDRRVVSVRKGLILAAQIAVLAAAVIAAALTSTRRATGSRSTLVLLLFVLAVGSDVLIVEMRGVRVSGAFLAVVLAMVLLGPAPAVAIGARRTTLVDAVRFAAPPIDSVLNDADDLGDVPARRRRSWSHVLARRAGDGDARLASARAVLVVFMVTNFLNFVCSSRCTAARLTGHRCWRDRKAVYLTVLPSEFATALLTAASRTATAARRRRGRRSPRSSSFVFQYLVWAPACRRSSAARSSPSAHASWRRSRSACSARSCRRCRCATR